MNLTDLTDYTFHHF